ncbi:hypothetical protein ACJ73_07316 [Blastomyces percursus]|uniref:Uncharacterized protein n=1 Tax=Blastomyces percursus TaxID=1658174 RepID=A0A1J9PYC7_9EURO|nr:hypothetical protein ACJ73_07316 [Blastomyces percursus]
MISVVDCHCRVLAYHLLRHRRDHWGMMMQDHTPLDSKTRDGKDYLLRREIMGIAAIFYRQMNDVDWDHYKHKYMKPVLNYPGGPLTVRVVQATCNPSYPPKGCEMNSLSARPVTETSLEREESVRFLIDPRLQHRAELMLVKLEERWKQKRKIRKASEYLID